MNQHLTHVLDLDVDAAPDALDLFAEELQPGTHTWSDCMSSASCFSTSGTALSLGTMGSIISCGS